jgi:hypothetical protein
MIALTGVVLAGCGAGTTPVPRTYDSARALIESVAGHSGTGSGPGAPVHYRDTGFGALVYNPGTPNAFTAYVTATRDVTVQPSSAASVRVISAGTPEFGTATDRAHWQAAGRPALDSGLAAGQVMADPVGQFSFLPQVKALTYQQATALPTTPAGVLAVVRADSTSSPDVAPPATLLLRQFGFLLAIAPLSPAGRSAAWRALLLVPGVRLCGTATDLAGRTGQGLCADGDGYEVEMLVDPAAGAMLEVRKSLTQRSMMYPGAAPGKVVEVDTFLPG